MFYVRYSRLFWIDIKKALRKNSWPFNKNVHKKIEKKITFKTKTGYYLELTTPETMKLLGSTKIKTRKNENGGKRTSFRNYWIGINTLQCC